MTTTTPSLSNRPIIQVSPVEWAKKNLFSSWFNTVLTVVSLLVLGWVAISLFSWAFGRADWAVVRNNFRLFLVGRYPVQFLWRVWASLGLLVATAGLTWGVLARNSRLLDRRGLITLGVLAAVVVIGLALLTDPISIVYSLILLVLLVGMAFVGQQLGRLKPNLGIWLPLIWLVVYLLAFALIRGLFFGRAIKLDDLSGLMLTLLVASISIVVSFPFGVLLALGRRSELPVIRWLSVLYIELVRGLPLITILFASQLLVPLALPNTIRTDRVVRVTIGFILFSAAYVAENVRGGLQAVPRGQTEAAKALGMNPVLATSLIVLPQALKAVIPTMVGLFISLFKDTSLMAIVGLTELLGMGQSILANPEYLGRNGEVYMFIGLIYFICCYAMSLASRRLEKQLNAPGGTATASTVTEPALQPSTGGDLA